MPDETTPDDEGVPEILRDFTEQISLENIPPDDAEEIIDMFLDFGDDIPNPPSPPNPPSSPLVQEEEPKRRRKRTANSFDDTSSPGTSNDVSVWHPVVDKPQRRGKRKADTPNKKPVKKRGRKGPDEKIDAKPPYISKDVLKKIKWRSGQFTETEAQFVGDTALPQEVAALQTPLQFFKYFFSLETVDKIVFETNLYSAQNNLGATFNSTDIQRYIGILLFTSIVRLPNVRNYWKSTIGSEIVQNAMRRNKFEKIRQCLHFNDNSTYDPKDPRRDRLHKIRPIHDAVLSQFQTIPVEHCLSLDEQICPTKNRTYLKQYLPLKPKKWGYKLYVLSGIDGYSYNFEIYTGHEETLYNETDFPNLGASGNVVVRLCKILSSEHHRLYFDNFYTSLPLMVYLEEWKQVHTLGTLRRNRIPGIPLTDPSKYMKQGRGSSEEYVGELNEVPLILVSWKDNKVVSLASTFVGCSPEGKVQRYDRQKKEKVEVTRPHIVDLYNRHMGGVDLLDANLARNRILLRSRKWYTKLFYHFLDLAIVNSWTVYKRVISTDASSTPLTLAAFKEEIAIALMKSGMKTSPTRGRPSASMMISTKRRGRPITAPPVDIRLDHGDHLPLRMADPQKCRHKDCKLKSIFRCKKCELHFCIKESNCWVKFHMNE